MSLLHSVSRHSLYLVPSGYIAFPAWIWGFSTCLRLLITLHPSGCIAIPSGLWLPITLHSPLPVPASQGPEVLSSLPLQVALYFNVHYYPFWLISMLLVTEVGDVRLSSKPITFWCCNAPKKTRLSLSATRSSSSSVSLHRSVFMSLCFSLLSCRFLHVLLSLYTCICLSPVGLLAPLSSWMRAYAASFVAAPHSPTMVRHPCLVRRGDLYSILSSSFLSRRASGSATRATFTSG